MEIPEDIKRVVRALCFEDEAFDDVCKAILAERERCAKIVRDACLEENENSMAHSISAAIMKGNTK